MQTTHFRFIYCVERLTLQNKHSEWQKCFQMSGLGTQPIDCYNNGYGGVVICFMICFALPLISSTFSYLQSLSTFDFTLIHSLKTNMQRKLLSLIPHIDLCHGWLWTINHSKRLVPHWFLVGSLCFSLLISFALTLNKVIFLWSSGLPQVYGLHLQGLQRQSQTRGLQVTFISDWFSREYVWKLKLCGVLCWGN